MTLISDMEKDKSPFYSICKGAYYVIKRKDGFGSTEHITFLYVKCDAVSYGWKAITHPDSGTQFDLVEVRGLILYVNQDGLVECRGKKECITDDEFVGIWVISEAEFNEVEGKNNKYIDVMNERMEQLKDELKNDPQYSVKHYLNKYDVIQENKPANPYMEGIVNHLKVGVTYQNRAKPGITNF